MSTTFDISAITPELLDQCRLRTDPIADRTVSQIITSGYEKQINQLFMTLVSNQSFDDGTFDGFEPELANILNNYFQKTSLLPDWADPSLIKVGESVFSSYGPEIFMLLNVSSLPMCYTCAKGAQVLFDTGRLMTRNGNIDPLARRLMETAQMIVNVMSPDGLAKEGEGIVTIQKIRLIHASIRYYLKNGKYNIEWDTDRFGEPINQEDLTGTLMSFAPVILSGLKNLNISLSEKEITGYMHSWKVVGYLMGIEEKLLPDNYEDAFELASKILTHQAEESEAGVELTKSCIKFINYIIPGNAFDHLPKYLMDYFLQDFSEASGKDLSKCIDVIPHDNHRNKMALAVTKYLTKEISHLEDSKFVKKISAVFNKFLLNGIIHHYNDGKSVHFFIPPSLKRDWKIDDEL